MRTSQGFLFWIRLAGFLPLAGALVAIDWISVQPPIRDRVAGPIDAAADALISGKTIWSSADMRDLKPAWIARRHDRRDVMILGGSRMLQVSGDWFQPRSVLNAAVAQGDLDDMVSIFQLLVETGQTPGMVVLELNPSLILAGKASPAPALSYYLRNALLRYRMLPPRLFSDFFSIPGVQSDVRLLLRPATWRISDEFLPGTYRMRPDGTADWYLTESKQTPDGVERAVVSTMHHLRSEYRHWRTSSKPDWFDLQVLRAFLDDLQSRRIRVVVLLAPVHPTAYEFYNRLGGYDEGWIRREMAARGIRVVGSYSPWVARATKADFFDDVHAHSSVLQRLLSEGGIIGSGFEAASASGKF